MAHRHDKGMPASSSGKVHFIIGEFSHDGTEVQYQYLLDQGEQAEGGGTVIRHVRDDRTGGITIILFSCIAALLQMPNPDI